VSLCEELGHCHKKVRSLGFLNLCDRYRHELYTKVQNSTSPSNRPLALPTLLPLASDTDGKQCRNELHLSRESRKRLSLQLCTSLLQLYQTPWITGEWDGNEIIFRDRGEVTHSATFRYPYLRRQVSYLPEAQKDTQAVLFRLGVLLLELCLGKRVSGNSLHLEKSRPNLEPDYDRWLLTAASEEGGEIADAIRKCIYFDFATHCRTLEKDDLRIALFNEVVRPLKAALGSFQME